MSNMTGFGGAYTGVETALKDNMLAVLRLPDGRWSMVACREEKGLEPLVSPINQASNQVTRRP